LRIYRKGEVEFANLEKEGKGFFSTQGDRYASEWRIGRRDTATQKRGGKGGGRREKSDFLLRASIKGRKRARLFLPGGGKRFLPSQKSGCPRNGFEKV